jgi:hypothetical protein
VKLSANKTACLLGALATLAAGTAVRADGIVIDKIYHPYVDALEKELEYRSIYQDRQPGLATPAQVHQLSLGTALGARMFTELYLVGAKSRDGNFSLDAWEAELKWQLTEQGEYAVDWGLLVEYEDEQNIAAQEFTVAVLAEKEWGNWSGTANLRLINEWGADIEAEFETALALQARYRYSRFFEPALEFYAGQNTKGLGPVVQGTFNTGVRKALHWEAGLIFGLDDESADQTWRFLLEYEF